VALTLARFYKGYKIHAGADEDRTGKTWMGRAFVSWGQTGNEQFHTICGSDPCDTQDEALIVAVDLAKEWINVQELISKQSA
jgi:hypothetical protein